ncbi:thioredoxin family protein [Candidatus Woesearchaeota archaeon]|nr:thioredoxin family protein [Candidatus Woesearchaeota archaeon]
MKLHETTRYGWAVFLLTLSLVSGCAGYGAGGDDGRIQPYVIMQNGMLPPAACTAEIARSVIMLESRYCGHCAVAKPMLEELAREKGVDLEVIDVSTDAGRHRTAELGIDIQFTPTTIFGCEVVIGGQSRDAFAAYFDRFNRR